MSSQVLKFFQMILRVSSYLYLYVISKYFGLSQVFLQKYLKLISVKKSLPVMLYPGLVPSPTIEDMFFQKAQSKRCVLEFLIISSPKIILVLLMKIVIFHIQVTIIKIEIPRLKWPIRSVFFDQYLACPIQISISCLNSILVESGFGVEVSLEHKESIELRVKCLLASLLQQIGDIIVEMKSKIKERIAMMEKLSTSQIGWLNY